MKASKRTLTPQPTAPTAAAPVRKTYRLSERQRRIILTNGPILLLLLAVPLVMNRPRSEADGEDRAAAVALAAAAEAQAEKLPPEELLREAGAGDPAALLVLGTRTYQGSHGIPADRAKGIALCRRAGEAGNPNGWFFAGFFLSETEAGMAEAVSCFEKAAAANHTVALGVLGSYWERGLAGRPRDAARALEYYRKAAALGDAEGLVAVARVLLEGEGVEHDVPEALRCLREAAARQSPRAHLLLSSLYASGNGVPTDLLKAATYARRAEELGDPRAHAVLMGQAAALLKSGDTALLTAAAEAGVPLIAAKLGIGYATGRGLPPDPEKAHRWLEQGAAEAVPEAQIELGRLLLLGLGKPADTARGTELLCVATDGAAETLGRLPAAGKGSPEAADSPEAKRRRDALAFITRLADILIEWTGHGPAPTAPLPLLCERVAAHSPTDALRLGTALLAETPFHTPDAGQGVLLLTAAEKAGNAEASFRLAEHFLKADNPGLAARHALMATEQEHPGALHLLAMLYAEGRGVPKNPAAARRYDRRAAKCGYAPAAERLKARTEP